MGIQVVGKTVNNQGSLVGYTLTNGKKEVFFTPDNLRNYLQMNSVDNCSILGNDFKITGSLWVRTLSPQKNEVPDNPLVKYIKSQNSQFIDLYIRVNTKTFEFTQITPQYSVKENMSIDVVAQNIQEPINTERILASELSVGSSKLDSVFGNTVKNTVESTILKDSCIFPKAWTRSTWEITGQERSKIFNRMCICRDKLIDAIKNKGSIEKFYPALGKLLSKWSNCDIVDLNSLKGDKVEILKDNSAIMRDLVVNMLKGSCTTGVAAGNKSEWWYTSPMKLNNFPSVVYSNKQSICYMPVVTIGDKPELSIGYCYELECVFLTDDKNDIPLVDSSGLYGGYFMHWSCFLTELKTPISQSDMVQQLGSLGLDVRLLGEGVEIPSLALDISSVNPALGTMHTDCVVLRQGGTNWFSAFNNTGSVLLPFSLVKAYVKESIKI